MNKRGKIKLFITVFAVLLVSIIYLNKPGITGGVTGTNPLSGWMFVAIIMIFTLFLITVIISQTILKLKKK